MVPEVFHRLYVTHNYHCGCDACTTGPIDHNHPEKSIKKNTFRKGSHQSSGKGKSKGGNSRK